MLPLLLRKALRDFWRLGLRTWLVMLCLAGGVAVYAAGFLATASVLNTRDVYCERLRLADLELTFEPSDAEELPSWMKSFLAGDAAPLRALGVQAATFRFVAPGAIEVGGDRRDDVGHLGGHRVPLAFGAGHDALDPQFASGLDHPDRDLTAVRDQESTDHDGFLRSRKAVTPSRPSAPVRASAMRSGRSPSVHPDVASRTNRLQAVTASGPDDSSA